MHIYAFSLYIYAEGLYIQNSARRGHWRAVQKESPEESGLRGFEKEVPAEQVLWDIVVGVVGVEPYLITIKSRVPVR